MEIVIDKNTTLLTADKSVCYEMYKSGDNKVRTLLVKLFSEDAFSDINQESDAVESYLKYTAGQEVVILNGNFGVPFGTILKIHNSYYDERTDEFEYDFQNADVIGSVPEKYLIALTETPDEDFNIAKFLKRYYHINQIYSKIDGYQKFHTVTSNDDIVLENNTYTSDGCLRIEKNKISLMHMLYPSESLMLKYQSNAYIAWTVYKYNVENHLYEESKII